MDRVRARAKVSLHLASKKTKMKENSKKELHTRETKMNNAAAGPSARAMLGYLVYKVLSALVCFTVTV